MTFTIKRTDTERARVQIDAPDSTLGRVFLPPHVDLAVDTQTRTEVQNVVVELRRALIRTIWERRGYLDMPYIDGVIRDTIRDFKNKHHTTIKQEYWGILVRFCTQAIAHASRIESDQEQEPVDIGNDDIDAWINSDFEE